MRLALILTVVLTSLMLGTVRPTAGGLATAQENDYRIVPGQRLGRFELGRRLADYGIGRPTWQWTGTTARGVPFWDDHFFVGLALNIHTCRGDGRVFAIFAYRRFDYPENPEAAKYSTAEGISIGVSEGEIFNRLGKPIRSSEWIDRHGTLRISVVEHTFPGLLIRVNRDDRKVFAIGVQTQEGRFACESDILVTQALQHVAQRPALSFARPVALTSCEAMELRRKLLADSESRILYGPKFRIAEQSMNEPPSPYPSIPEPISGSPTEPEMLFSRDVQRIEALGFAYAATGDPRYAERAATYLDAWASTYQPIGHPIVEKDISGLVRGFSLVNEAIPGIVRTEVERWLARLASLQIERRPRWEIETPTNYFSYRLKVVGMIGYVLGDTEFVKYGEDGYRAQIAQNLRPDGSSLDFHQRDALTYHEFNVRALLELAIAADKNRVGLYAYQAPSGASLERSIAFLLPYVRREKIHAEFVRSSVAVDRRRRDAGTPWDPRRGAWLLEMAAYFNPVFAAEPIVAEVGPTVQTFWNRLRMACGGK